MASDPTRRTFLKSTVAAGCAVGAAGAVTMTPRSARAKTHKLTPEDGKVMLKAEDAKKLAEVGGAAKVKIEGHEKVLVVRTGEEEYKTLSRKCTHEGCNVKWSKDDNRFNCPCHESSFNLKGETTGGPAKDPLLAYPTEFADGVITITIPEDAPKDD